MLLLVIVDSIPAAAIIIFDAAADNRRFDPAAANSRFDAAAANSRFDPCC